MIKEKNGHRYSLKSFNGYTHRHKILIDDARGAELANFDVYTTNDSKKEIEHLFFESATKKYKIDLAATVIHTATKAQDQAATELIDSLV